MATTSEAAPPNATETFLAELQARGHEPMLGRVSGTIQLELEDTKRVDHWFIRIAKGDITCERGVGDGDPDARVIAEKKLFDEVVTGRVNVMAAMLRGVIDIYGDFSLLMLWQKILPGPPRGATAATKKARR